MLHATTTPAARRSSLRAALASGRLLQFPGVLNPMSALMIQERGFDGIYISGAVLANDLGLPDIALTSLSEVTQRAHQISRVTDLPTLLDIDTGFGGTLNVARTMQVMEELGVAACQIEDQVPQKRCGHLDGKELVSCEEMVFRIRAAASARRDPNFVIVARTDARAVEGLDEAMARMQAYRAAGADVIFPEALTSVEDFQAVRQQIDAPLLANMTEFGKSPLLTTTELSDLGYSIAIYPVTLQRLAMSAIETGLEVLQSAGTQESLVPSMQTRARLYEVVDYKAYDEFQATVEGVDVSSN
jgi:methylisocitrate lyase